MERGGLAGASSCFLPERQQQPRTAGACRLVARCGADWKWQEPHWGCNQAVLRGARKQLWRRQGTQGGKQAGRAGRQAGALSRQQATCLLLGSLASLLTGVRLIVWKRLGVMGKLRENQLGMWK